MQVFIVAVEARAPEPGCDSASLPLERAYDLETAYLVGHTVNGQPDVSFPASRRGWGNPAQDERCPPCDHAVEAAVRDIVSGALSAVHERGPTGKSGPKGKSGSDAGPGERGKIIRWGRAESRPAPG